LEILIATNNPHKLAEYQAILGDGPWHLLSLKEVGIASEVDETGHTYADNARLKATAAARLSGLLTLADDSGLEVDALGGAPGIRSARYAGEGASGSARIERLLQALAGVPADRRQARFVCVIVLATGSQVYEPFVGECHGVIVDSPRGQFGFGYDPVFYLPDYGCTMAELPPAIKNQISHRARAVAAVRPLLYHLAHPAPE